MGMLTVISTIASLGGLLLYKYALYDSSWQHNYIGTTIVGVISSAMQLLLVFRVTSDIDSGLSLLCRCPQLCVSPSLLFSC